MSRALRELAEALVLALLVFMLIQGSVRNFRVEGASMVPTLEGGQFLLVNKLVYFKVNTSRLSKIIPFWKNDTPSEHFAIHPPKRGDVIVFRFPLDTSKDFVKRVIALPGETIELRDGQVYIDGALLAERYLAPDVVTMPARPDTTQWTIGEKEYFVMGDNRGSSNDSRTWGEVPEENVLGKVWLVYWPIPEVQVLDAVSNFTRNFLP